MTSPGLLIVDDEPENVETAAAILRDSYGIEVVVVDTVEAAVAALHRQPWRAVIMDLFIPLGDDARRVLGPRFRKYQEHVAHLGGLVLLEEIERLGSKPVVVSHTACTEHALLELFGDRVTRRIPKPAPLEVLLHEIGELLSSAD